MAPPGMGKSHVLAALVCHPVWYKERFIYLPSFRTLVMHTRECLPSLLLFVFHDDHHFCGKINIVKGVNHFVEKRRRPPDVLNVLNRDGLASTASS